MFHATMRNLEMGFGQLTKVISLVIWLYQLMSIVKKNTLLVLNEDMDAMEVVCMNMA